MSNDPDRYNPNAAATGPAVPLDPALDPDRYRPPTGKGGSTLPDLLGEGAQEQDREGYSWALGLLGVLVFLLLVSLAVHL